MRNKGLVKLPLRGKRNEVMPSATQQMPGCRENSSWQLLLPSSEVTARFRLEGISGDHLVLTPTHSQAPLQVTTKLLQLHTLFWVREAVSNAKVIHLLVQSKSKEHKDVLLQIQLLPLCRGTALKDFKCNVLLIEPCHPHASNTEVVKSASWQAQ